MDVAFVAAARHSSGFVLQSLRGDPQLLVVRCAFGRGASFERLLIQGVQLRGVWHVLENELAEPWRWLGAILLLFLLFCACLNCAILNRSLEKVSAGCLSLAIG